MAIAHDMLKNCRLKPKFNLMRLNAERKEKGNLMNTIAWNTDKLSYTGLP